MSIINKFYQLRVHEADHTFTTMGPDDVALDMDTEIGYITEEGSNDKREDDLDNSSDSGTDKSGHTHTHKEHDTREHERHTITRSTTHENMRDTPS